MRTRRFAPAARGELADAGRKGRGRNPHGVGLSGPDLAVQPPPLLESEVLAAAHRPAVLRSAFQGAGVAQPVRACVS
jgi:hypothetical protein